MREDGDRVHLERIRDYLLKADLDVVSRKWADRIDAAAAGRIEQKPAFDFFLKGDEAEKGLKLKIQKWLEETGKFGGVSSIRIHSRLLIFFLLEKK